MAASEEQLGLLLRGLDAEFVFLLQCKLAPEYLNRFQPCIHTLVKAAFHQSQQQASFCRIGSCDNTCTVIMYSLSIVYLALPCMG